jgi:bacteriorhodopsin
MSLYYSLLLSIITQIITGIIEFIALFIEVPPHFLILKQMMLLEVIVQFIEGAFYLYWLYNFKKISNITPKRYLDWTITTPVMLINLIFYMIFLRSNNDLDFFQVFNREFYTIITILILNWTMLLFGYLGEIGAIPIMLGVGLGFIPFLLYYYIIYKNYGSNELFFYFFIVWSLYGVVAILPYKTKNMCYNILDLFSKNFFGLFLTYLLLSS